MRKFCKEVFYFLLPILLLAYPVDFFLSHFLKKSNTYAEGEYPTWNDIYSGTINSEIIINGSSRAVQHINPKILENSLHASVYNLGMLGQSFELQQLRYQLLLKYNKPPQLIIHSLDVSTLVPKSEFNSEQFLPYMLFDTVIMNATTDYRNFAMVDYLLPLVRYYGKYEAMKVATQMALRIGSSYVGRTKGYVARDDSWNQDFERARAKMRKLFIKVDTVIIRDFERYIIKCKESDLDLVLVYSPEYIDGQKFVENRSSIINIYKILGEKYDTRFYNYSADELSNDKSLFYNASHLNSKGSELFSRKLAQKLVDEGFNFSNADIPED